MTVIIELGPVTTPRLNFIAEAALPAGTPLDGAWVAVDAETGAETPAQVDDVAGAPRVSWHVPALAAGEPRSYELKLSAGAADATRGRTVPVTPRLAPPAASPSMSVRRYRERRTRLRLCLGTRLPRAPRY